MNMSDVGLALHPIPVAVLIETDEHGYVVPLPCDDPCDQEVLSVASAVDKVTHKQSLANVASSKGLAREISDTEGATLEDDDDAGHSHYSEFDSDGSMCYSMESDDYDASVKSLSLAEQNRRAMLMSSRGLRSRIDEVPPSQGYDDNDTHSTDSELQALSFHVRDQCLELRSYFNDPSLQSFSPVQSAGSTKDDDDSASINSDPIKLLTFFAEKALESGLADAAAQLSRTDTFDDDSANNCSIDSETRRLASIEQSIHDEIAALDCWWDHGGAPCFPPPVIETICRGDRDLLPLRVDPVSGCAVASSLERDAMPPMEEAWYQCDSIKTKAFSNGFSERSMPLDPHCFPFNTIVDRLWPNSASVRRETTLFQTGTTSLELAIETVMKPSFVLVAQGIAIAALGAALGYGKLEVSPRQLRIQWLSG